MMLLIHIAIALAGVLFTSYLVFKPSERGVKVSYSLVGGTLASGFGMVFLTGAPMLRTCISGLLYTVLVTAGIMVAQHRLATQESYDD